MFTGIIEAKGRFLAYGARGKKETRFDIDAGRLAKFMKIGGSLAVNGVCLTVVRRAGRRLRFSLLNETLRRTHLGRLKAGESVNLERPMKANARVEGHFVLGHADGEGRITAIRRGKGQKSFQIAAPAPFTGLIVEKGSVAVNGVSLTVGRVARGRFWVHCVGYTLKNTNLDDRVVGDSVNLEADALARFFTSLMRQVDNRKGRS